MVEVRPRSLPRICRSERTLLGMSETGRDSQRHRAGQIFPAYGISWLVVAGVGFEPTKLSRRFYRPSIRLFCHTTYLLVYTHFMCFLLDCVRRRSVRPESPHSASPSRLSCGASTA